jgi:hypothetical protein
MAWFSDYVGQAVAHQTCIRDGLGSHINRVCNYWDGAERREEGPL